MKTLLSCLWQKSILLSAWRRMAFNVPRNVFRTFVRLHFLFRSNEVIFRMVGQKKCCCEYIRPNSAVDCRVHEYNQYVSRLWIFVRSVPPYLMGLYLALYMYNFFPTSSNSLILCAVVSSVEYCLAYKSVVVIRNVLKWMWTWSENEILWRWQLSLFGLFVWQVLGSCSTSCCCWPLIPNDQQLQWFVTHALEHIGRLALLYHPLVYTTCFLVDGARQLVNVTHENGKLAFTY